MSRVSLATLYIEVLSGSGMSEHAIISLCYVSVIVIRVLG
jgi:hypothetical protein